MGAASEFLDEVNPLFGFFFDIGFAITTARKRLEELQQELGADDDSPFMVRDGSPTGSVEEELEKSLHRCTVGEFKRRMEDNGFDLTKAAEAVIIFTFHLWDEKYRQRIAGEHALVVDDLQVDILGDLRLIRNSIIHNKAVAAPDISRCKVITRFKPGDTISLNKYDIHHTILALREQLAPYTT